MGDKKWPKQLLTWLPQGKKKKSKMQNVVGKGS